MYMRMSRGIFTSVMMKEPFATVPRWYRTSLRTDDRMGVTGSRFLSLEHRGVTGPGSAGRRPWASQPAPGEVVGDHGSSHGHLLAGQDELGDPHQTHGVVPGQVAQGPRQSEFGQTRLLVLDRVPCNTARGGITQALALAAVSSEAN